MSLGCSLLFVASLQPAYYAVGKERPNSKDGLLHLHDASSPMQRQGVFHNSPSKKGKALDASSRFEPSIW